MAQPKVVTVFVSVQDRALSKAEMQGLHRTLGANAVALGAWKGGAYMAVPFDGTCKTLAQKIYEALQEPTVHILVLEFGGDCFQRGTEQQRQSLEKLRWFRS